MPDNVFWLVEDVSVARWKKDGEVVLFGKKALNMWLDEEIPTIPIL